MKRLNKRLLTICLAAVMLGGGALSAVALGASGHHKARGKAKAAHRAGTTTGTFRSNEDPAHEAGESAAREQDEANGIRGPRGRGGSNEDASHESGESAAREAQEDAARTTTTP